MQDGAPTLLHEIFGCVRSMGMCSQYLNFGAYRGRGYSSLLATHFVTHFAKTVRASMIRKIADKPPHKSIKVSFQISDSEGYLSISLGGPKLGQTNQAIEVISVIAAIILTIMIRRMRKIGVRRHFLTDCWTFLAARLRSQQL